MVVAAAANILAETVQDVVAVLPFVIDYIRFLVNKTALLDATGQLTIDLNKSVAQFTLQDQGQYMIFTNMSTAWNMDTGFVIDMQEALIKSDQDVYVELETGRFMDEGGKGSFLVVSRYALNNPDVAF